MEKIGTNRVLKDKKLCFNFIPTLFGGWHKRERDSLF